MDVREILHLDRIQGGRGDQRPDGTDPHKFQNLLEELQKLNSARRATEGKPTDSDESTDLGEFADELRRADEDYAALMDVRRKLEEAFRRQIP